MRSIAWRRSSSPPKRTPGRLDPAGALDPDLPGPVDHHLVDRGVGEQRLERTEARRALGDARDELRAGVLVEHARLAIDERADALVQLAVRTVAPGLGEQALAQRAGERVERGVIGGASASGAHVHARARRAAIRPRSGSR